jgi:hypothetical protein
MRRLSESTVEGAALAWLETIGWRIAHRPDIAPDMPAAERRDAGEIAVRIGQPPDSRSGDAEGCKQPMDNLAISRSGRPDTWS